VTDDNSGFKAVYVSLDDEVFSAVTLAGSSWSTNISVSTYGEHTNYVYAVDNSNNISVTNYGNRSSCCCAGCYNHKSG